MTSTIPTYSLYLTVMRCVAGFYVVVFDMEKLCGPNTDEGKADKLEALGFIRFWLTSIAIHHGTFQLTDESLDAPQERLAGYARGESFVVLDNGQFAEFR